MKIRLTEFPKILLLIMNILALTGALIWSYYERDFEPIITSLALASSLIALLLSGFKTRPKHQQRPPSTIIVADDDLSEESELFRQIAAALSDRGTLKLTRDPREANDLLTSDDSIVGCITDIVFRSSSELAGVQIAETAIREMIPVVVITGHKRRNIGLALEELRRIGVSESRILRKPVTYRQYKTFLTELRGWIVGI